MSRPPPAVLPSAAAVAAGLPEQRRRRSARIEERRLAVAPLAAVAVQAQEEKLADELFPLIFPDNAIRAAKAKRRQLRVAIDKMRDNETFAMNVNYVAQRNRAYLNGFIGQDQEKQEGNIGQIVGALRREVNLASQELFLDYASSYFFGTTFRYFYDTVYGVRNQVESRQTALFGKDDVLAGELASAVTELDAILKGWDGFFLYASADELPAGVSVTSPLRDQLRALLIAALHLMPRTAAAVQKSRALIRRTCSNREDIFSGDAVEDIPDDAFIQTLSNRQCYDMSGLVGYIKNVSNGRNEQPYSAEEVAANSVALRNGQPLLPRRPIWHIPTNNQEDEDEDELTALLDHPVAEEADLREFLDSRSAAALAQQISDAQLYRLGQLAAIMRSRGETFVDAARPYFTDEEMQRWLAVRGEQERAELPPSIRRAVPSVSPGASVDSRLRYKINEMIKPPAVLEFLHYLEAQPQAFRDALAMLSPTLERDLRSCANGTTCVMLMGNDVAKAHDAIAAAKPDYVQPP